MLSQATKKATPLTSAIACGLEAVRGLMSVTIPVFAALPVLVQSWVPCVPELAAKKSLSFTPVLRPGAEASATGLWETKVIVVPLVCHRPEPEDALAPGKLMLALLTTD